jgi:hypothetical protein
MARPAVGTLIPIGGGGGLREASGVTSVPGNTLTITGLAFRPRIITLEYWQSSYVYRYHYEPPTGALGVADAAAFQKARLYSNISTGALMGAQSDQVIWTINDDGFTAVFPTSIGRTFGWRAIE